MPKAYNRRPGSNKPGRPAIPVKPVSKGLPPKEIVLDQVIYWIGLQATAEEIASSFYVSADTLDTTLKEHFGKSFSELKKQCDGSGKLSVRRFQFKQAEKNCSMAIWLGKQWLGQKDHEEPKQTYPNDPAIASLLSGIKAQDTIAKLESKVKELEEKLNGLSNKDHFNLPAID